MITLDEALRLVRDRLLRSHRAEREGYTDGVLDMFNEMIKIAEELKEKE